jgi:hypothetical protein
MGYAAEVPVPGPCPRLAKFSLSGSDFLGAGLCGGSSTRVFLVVVVAQVGFRSLT